MVVFILFTVLVDDPLAVFHTPFHVICYNITTSALYHALTCTPGPTTEPGVHVRA